VSHDDLLRENEALRQRLARAERIVVMVEMCSEAIVSTSTDGTIVCWNTAAERLFGFPAGLAIGRNILELVPFDRLHEHREAVSGAAGGKTVVLATRRRRDDGSELAVAVTYARLADPDGKLTGYTIMAHAAER
jgi:PAS domain S-box-containing protein